MREFLSSGAWGGIGALAAVAMVVIYLLVERRKIFGGSTLPPSMQDSKLSKDSVNRELMGMLGIGIAFGIFLSFLLFLRSSSMLWLAQAARAALLSVTLWGLLVPLPVVLLFFLAAFSIGRSTSEKVGVMGFVLLPHLGTVLILGIVYIFSPGARIYIKELVDAWL